MKPGKGVAGGGKRLVGLFGGLFVLSCIFFFIKEIIYMHIENVKDNTNQSRADLFPLWSLEVPATSLGVGVRV